MTPPSWAEISLMVVIVASVIISILMVVTVTRAKQKPTKEAEVQEVLAAWQRLSNGLNTTFYSGKVPQDKAMADFLMKGLPATMAGMDKAVVDLVKK